MEERVHASHLLEDEGEMRQVMIGEGRRKGGGKMAGRKRVSGGGRKEGGRKWQRKKGGEGLLDEKGEEGRRWKGREEAALYKEIKKSKMYMKAEERKRKKRPGKKADCEGERAPTITRQNNTKE